MREFELSNILKEKGHFIGGVFIQDLTGLGRKHIYRPALKVIETTTYIDSDNHPEMLRKLYILNCPRIFSGVWRMISHWFDKNILEKIAIKSSGYYDELNQFMDEEEIPDFLGGSFDTSGIVPIGGPYTGREKLKIKKGKKITVPARDDRELEFIIDEPSHLSWVFATSEFDILFKIQDRKGKDLIQEMRTASQSSSLVINRKKKVKIIFDNTYSWTKKKTIKYRIDISPIPEFSDEEIEVENTGITTKETQPKKKKPKPSKDSADLKRRDSKTKSKRS
eukprot:TRINITY_DN502_c0_g1_i2.p1 TRINITY_DN502_c0_g1~~TRINITY_DN502_c0_g1_i2.p1  ORF type:complete len:279 (-),score=66.61 TRINITY_DN502_c0_g1_i2:117-953(-)